MLAILALTTVPEHSSCREWAEAGECDRNQGYMRPFCSSACSCARWVARGECEAAPHYMQTHCAEECECVRRVADNGCVRVAVTTSQCPEACAEEARRKAVEAEAEATAAGAAVRSQQNAGAG